MRLVLVRKDENFVNNAELIWNVKVNQQKKEEEVVRQSTQLLYTLQMKRCSVQGTQFFGLQIVRKTNPI